MTDLLSARPDDVRRAGAVLGQAADALEHGITGCRRAVAVDWEGSAVDAYQRRLDAFARELSTARGAYDATCDAVLHAETDRAQGLGRWERTERFVQHAADAAAEQVTTTVGVARSVWDSLPGVGTAATRTSARSVLGQVVHDVVRPWVGLRDLVGQVRDEHYAQLLGGALPSLVLWRKPGRFDTRLFGSHDRMHTPVLRALHRVDGHDPDLDRWVRTRAQRQFLERLEHFRRLPAPTIDELVRDGIDLVQQEALGGHTLLKHVGRDADFLARRQRVESAGTTLLPFSTFLDARDLEAAINTWLHGPGAVLLREFAASSERGGRFEVPLPVDALVRDSAGMTRTARTAVLQFRRSPGGEVRLHTAFATEGGSDAART